MDKPAEEKIVERLKSEGDLIRNTGTNSIKAVRSDLAKFHDVFQSINTNMIEQTQILRDTLDFHLGVDRRNERAQQLEEAKRTASEQKEKTTGREESTSPGRPSTRSITDSENNGSSRFGLRSLFGAGALGAGAGIGLAALYRRVIGRGVLIAAAPVIGAALNDLVTEAFEGMDFTPEVASSFGEAAGLAGLWGAIGLAFGRRYGLAGATAGALASLSDEILDGIGIDPNTQMSVFGMEFSAGAGATGLLAAIGATAGFLAPSLLGLTGTLLAGVLTGPVGLAALGGAAIAGTVMLIENWLQRRRDEFIAELEQKTSEGFANIRGVAQEPDVSMLRRFALSTGLASPQDRSEELDALRRTVEGSSTLTGMGDFGEAGSRMVMDLGRRESLSASVRNILGEDSSIAGLSPQNLIDLRTIAEQLDMQDLVMRIEELRAVQSNISDTERRISVLQRNIADTETSIINTDGTPQPSETRRISEWNDEIISLQNTLRSLLEQAEGFRTGTRGFQDFGRGSFAVLHGREAVVPESTPAGQFLQNFFDENWQPTMARLNEVSSAAVGQNSSSINYTPVTIAPVTSNNVRGGSNVTTITSISTRSADLDALARPGGVH